MMFTKSRFRFTFALVASVFLLAGAAMAQDAAPAEPLADALEEPVDTPHADTALVVTNLGNAAVRVGMRAWTHLGVPLGFKEISVPGNGLTYVFASEVAEAAGVDAFVGKVEARGAGKLTASSVVIGPGVTDVPTFAKVTRVPLASSRPSTTEAATQVTHLTFPLVVTY